MSNENETRESITPKCGGNCAYFYGTNQSSTEGAPPAWCNPPGSAMAQPCQPGENADNKACFKPALKLH